MTPNAFHFTYTERDYYDLCDEVWRNDTTLTDALLRQRSAVGTAVGFVAFCVLLGFRFSLLAVVLLVALASAAGYYLTKATEPYSMRRHARRSWRDSKRRLGQPFSVFIETNGLRYDYGDCEALYKWPLLYGVRKTETQLILNQKDGDRLYIPRRAFADAAQETAFLTRIEREIAAPAALTAPSPTTWYHSKTGVDTGAEISRISGQ